MIAVHCLSCGHGLEVPETDLGQPLHCPRCGQAVRIDSSSSRADALASPFRPEARENRQKPTPPPTRNAGSQDTPTCASPIAAGSSVAFAFLAPAQGPGELGWLAHYRVVRLLGQGGMGMVFEAVDTHLQRPVALKVIKPELSQDLDFRQRFLREARAMAAVRSDHIVTVHHVGQDNDVPFLAMEFLQGEPLDRWLEKRGPPKMEEVLRLATEITQGLAAAHESGLIHRDIKPANIWIEHPLGRVKILDFGLARTSRDGARLTQTGLVMGTPEYMAPEQAEGVNVDERSDLFSLGCVLYELATGQRPFIGPSTLAILKAVALKDPTPPRELSPSVPPALASLVMQLLAKKPEDRPASAQTVTEALQAIARDPGAAAPPPAGRSARRRWMLAGLAGAAVILLMVYFLGTRLFSPRDGSSASQGGAVRPRATAQGVTEAEVLLGMSAPFSGPSRELGRGMELGINTYLHSVNDEGGVAGRKLRLVALDDGYEPERALANMQELDQQRKVFAVIGNVGTPTAEKTLPYALEKQLIYFGAFTGAKLLRMEPPDRFVFNYRASYEEETATIVRYLVDIRKVRPEQIAVFAQQDSYGDAGFRGVVRTLRKHGRDPEQIIRVGHARNSLNVDEAVRGILKHKEIRAVVMVSTYGPSARFIQRVKDGRKDMIFTNVSFVGSNALAEELVQLGPDYSEGVIVTQVVPHPESQASAALKYRELLRRHYPSERPGFVSLEGYIAAALLVEGIRGAGDNLTTVTLIEALESIRRLDLGLGRPLGFSPSAHQASDKVWGTVLDGRGRFQILDLED